MARRGWRRVPQKDVNVNKYVGKECRRLLEFRETLNKYIKREKRTKSVSSPLVYPQFSASLSIAPYILLHSHTMSTCTLSVHSDNTYLCTFLHVPTCSDINIYNIG